MGADAPIFRGRKKERSSHKAVPIMTDANVHHVPHGHCCQRPARTGVATIDARDLALRSSICCEQLI